MTSNEYRIPSLLEKEQNKLAVLFNTYKNELFLIGLNQKQTDSVVKLIKSMMSATQHSMNFLFKNTALKPEKIVDSLLDHGKYLLDSMDSHYKRFLINNHIIWILNYIEIIRQ